MVSDDHTLHFYESDHNYSCTVLKFSFQSILDDNERLQMGIKE